MMLKCCHVTLFGLTSLLAVSFAQEYPTPYFFPKLAHAGNNETLFPMAPCGNFTLEEATIDEMQHAMRTGRLTAHRLTACYMTRIFQTQPYIKCGNWHAHGTHSSILELNPDALDIAASLDAERTAGHVRGPLHGIPVIVKDNIASKDKMQTTAGSWALLASVVPRDAFVVKKLREAGAVLLGKATLSEWADMRSNNYSEGYSARGGQARSPYNLTLNPGGSSSGSAAGVAANVVAFALGTETDGSVINPAERNAVVGIKPTVGRTSRSGVVPESIHQDTVGTFGRTVRDATLALDAIWGIDPRDNYTLAQRGKGPSRPGGFAAYLTDRKALKGASFGLPWKSFWVHADREQQKMLLELIDLIKKAGATIVNGTEITDYKVLVDPAGWSWDYGTTRGFPNESEYTVVKVDFYNNIANYLSELNNTKVRSVKDIVDYNYANDGTEGGHPYPLGIPAFYSGQDGFLASLHSGGKMDKTYWQALNFCQSKTRGGIDDALSRHGGLSALLVPPDVAQTYQIAAQAGYPMLTLPAGVHSESSMPFGLALMQTAWAEGELVKWGSAIEDLQYAVDTPLKRTLPRWKGYLERNIPVLNA